MALVFLQNVGEAANTYGKWVSDWGFSVATGVFLVILFAAVLVFGGRWIMNTIAEKIDSNGRRIEDLDKGQDELREILNEINTQTKVALNIILKGRINGNGKD